MNWGRPFSEGKLTVALDITVTDDLRREGVARELINRIQNIRKDSGFEVTDLPWKTNFLKKAYASQRQIVPVFVEGRLSNFFYRVDRIRRMLGVKFNIEMLWLSDEMFSQKGKHFRILVGDPIPVAELQRYGALRDQADYVRKKAYFLENMLLPAENNG